LARNALLTRGEMLATGEAMAQHLWIRCGWFAAAASREAVALACTDQAQHLVTITILQGLQGCPIREDGVGRQQEVERDSRTRRSEAAHDLG
jgi:hypothetical protein